MDLGFEASIAVASVLAAVAGVGYALHLRRERRQAERSFAALSTLNLTASSLSPSDMHKALEHVLAQLIEIVRVPAGALAVYRHIPGQPGPTITTGIREETLATAREEGLGEELSVLVARSGGIAVFRDLTREPAWKPLEAEPAFPRFRELMLAEGMRTVVGISLQAQDVTVGLLLLGTPIVRRFTPSEHLLFLSLGRQIGMAVENCYAVQQSTRRSEELRVLNEFGRALSSTLEPDALFGKIYEEVRRLLNASNFYIATYDSSRDVIHFALEIASGERLPKRFRRAGNHLTEYILRTRQGVLIRDRWEHEATRIGVVPLQRIGCFCGVPLVLHDRAIGAMAVYSHQERVFDEGHLELMNVLASQAVIAIENARLFAEEQTKSRHLALLNNISRHAISTLDSTEMLASITEEMEKSLTFAHIGVVLMDYASKDLAVAAVAGRGANPAEVCGRRIALGEGLVGQVARSGRLAAVENLAPGGPQLLLPASRSGLALPVVYADQLLGILYVENPEPTDFSDEETLLLRTLADLVAGALHNAFTFQRAQEQAITDGLTAVKTHRFFMEALSAEWKRSTRAGRSFALVLMDLDRFKFVNDYYGHLEGDLVLQRIGQILEQNCRRSDVVARYGGDEFVVLMPETTVEQAQSLAGKLRGCIASDSLLREKNITGSFGVAGFPAHGSTPQELIQVADASMYISKHQGGNTVSTVDHVDPAETKKWKRDVLEAYLGVALKRLFSTGPEAFEEIYRRLSQFSRSLLSSVPGVAGTGTPPTADPKLPGVVIETLSSLAFAIDAKDQYTQGHSRKVSAYSVILARALELPDREVEELRLAGILHDVGKVGIPEVILNKAGPLDPDEWEIMKTHPVLGAQVIEPLSELAAAGAIQGIVRHHHEFFDGSGYPAGLRGDEIPRGARIVAIADAFDTITSDRTYKKARSPEDAYLELERCAGAQFDPQLVHAFVEAMRQRPLPTVPDSGAPEHAAPPGAAP